MNNQAKICKLKCKYNVQGICSTYGECIAKDLFISELEKIKKKIKNDCILHEEWFVNIDDLEKCLCRIDAIIDKEISELKGE